MKYLYCYHGLQVASPWTSAQSSATCRCSLHVQPYSRLRGCAWADVPGVRRRRCAYESLKSHRCAHLCSLFPVTTN